MEGRSHRMETDAHPELPHIWVTETVRYVYSGL